MKVKAEKCCCTYKRSRTHHLIAAVRQRPPPHVTGGWRHSEKAAPFTTTRKRIFVVRCNTSYSALLLGRSLQEMLVCWWCYIRVELRSSSTSVTWLATDGWMLPVNSWTDFFTCPRQANREGKGSARSTCSREHNLMATHSLPVITFSILL
jgi:hypothetical protein